MNGYEQPTGNPHRKTHSKRRPKVPKIPEKERELRTAKDAHSPLQPNQRPSDARLLADLERAYEDLGRLIGALPGVLGRLRDAEQGQPAAQAYGDNGRRVVLWCSRHESDRCTEPDSAGELIPCSTLIAHPMRPDSVGEAAVNPDQARADETTLVRAIVGDPTLQNGGLVAQVERAMVVVAAWSPRAADVAALQSALGDDCGAPGPTTAQEGSEGLSGQMSGVSGDCGNCHHCLPGRIVSQAMVLCSDCGNKRCPHATDHRLDCTGSNELGQPGSAYK